MKIKGYFIYKTTDIALTENSGLGRYMQNPHGKLNMKHIPITFS